MDGLEEDAVSVRRRHKQNSSCDKRDMRIRYLDKIKKLFSKRGDSGRWADPDEYYETGYPGESFPCLYYRMLFEGDYPPLTVEAEKPPAGWAQRLKGLGLSLLARLRKGLAPVEPGLAAEVFPERGIIWRDVALLLVFLFFGYLLRKAFMIGMAWADDFDYAQIAVMINENRFNPVDIGKYNLYGWRFAMIFPLAFTFKYFQSTAENIAVIWPLFSSLATAVCLYIIGRKLFDSKTGLVAAVLLILYPADVFFSTCVLTETPFNFVQTLSVLFFVLAEESRRWWIKLPLFLISGSVATWMLYGRPYGIVILAAFGAFMMIRYIANWRYLFILIGFAATLYGIEYMVHKHTGLWMENFNVMKRLIDPYSFANSNISEHLDFYRKTLFGNRMHYPHFYILLMGFGVLFNWRKGMPGRKPLSEEEALEKRRKQNGFFVLFWMASLLLYIEFGFMNLEHMSLFHKLDRYLTIVAPPICLGAAPFLARFPNRWAIVLTALIFLGLAFWWYNNVMPAEMKPLLRFP